MSLIRMQLIIQFYHFWVLAHFTRFREKETMFQKFLKGVPKKQKIVKSTDGQLFIPKTQQTAKKPGQRKRVKCARTQKW